MSAALTIKDHRRSRAAAEGLPGDHAAASMKLVPEPLRLPRKHDLFGVRVSAATYEEVLTACVEMARRRQGGAVDLMAVHSLVTAARDEDYRNKVNNFEICAPDGQPVRWALNWFHKSGLSDRVYGPRFTWLMCERAAAEKVPIYLYGGTEAVLEALEARLRDAIPGLEIAGSESPPFRPLTEEEDEAVVRRVNASGAGLMFIGIGCPKQELFAFAHRDRIKAVQLCVGAAFDFHAGVKKMAPAWMQKRGLEWLFRLTQEPQRLWKRYLVTNSIYLYLCAREMLLGRRSDTVPDDADELLGGEELGS
jgi:exopolysaccharide biosynthesis WecB/TagA/CpsF family protein